MFDPYCHLIPQAESGYQDEKNVVRLAKAWRIELPHRGLGDFCLIYDTSIAARIAGRPIFLQVADFGLIHSPILQHFFARSGNKRRSRVSCSRARTNCRTTYLEKSGHFVQREDPDSLVRAIEVLLGSKGAQFPATFNNSLKSSRR